MSQSFSSSFIAKFTFRFLHIAPVVALAGKIINDYLFGPKEAVALTGGAKTFYAISGILLVVAGIVNTFVILKPKESMGAKAKLWLALSHSKLLFSLIAFTPLINLFTTAQSKLTIQFWLVVVFLVISPFMRYYREFNTTANKSDQGNNRIFLFPLINIEPLKEKAIDKVMYQDLADEVVEWDRSAREI